MHRTPFSAMALLGILAATAPAATVDDVTIEYWTGTGSAKSYLVVDFAATGDGSYAFGYNWDGTSTISAYDMITAIDAGGGLDVTATDYGSGTPNYFIDNIWYGTAMGDAGQYWDQWEGPFGANDVDWSLGTGVSNVNLTDGLFIGVRNPYTGTVTPSTPGVPEPGSLLMLAGVALVGLMARRRR